MNSRPAKPVIKAKTDVLTFGQYRDKTVRWILEHDPSYIIWLDDEGVCSVSQEILDNAEDEELNQQIDDAMDWWRGDWDD